MFAAKDFSFTGVASASGFESTGSSVGGISFSSNTQFVINNTLPNYGTELGACNSSLSGYWSGGFETEARIRKLAFTNLATSTLSSTLTSGRTAMGACNSATTGYFGPGYLKQYDANKMPFSTESVSNIGAFIAKIRYASVNSSAKGYFLCGINAFNGSTSEWGSINFSTETVGSTGNTGVSFSPATGFNSTTAGYFTGSTSVRKLTFSTEGFSTIGATTSTAYGYNAAFNSLTSGYFVNTTTNVLDFTTETFTAISTPSLSSSAGAGCQSGGIL